VAPATKSGLLPTFVVHFRATMHLGLFIACLYVIFHRSGARWRTAGRMVTVLFAVLIFFAFVVAAFPRFTEQLRLLSPIAALTASIVAGFRHAKAFPRAGRDSNQSPTVS
jgi:hypothetical protein